MIDIKIAKEEDAQILALLGRITYAESHGHFIDDKADLLKYCDEAFSFSKTKNDLKNPKNLFFIITVNGLSVGYAKLILNKSNENISENNSCCLERIYILNDFIPMKIGRQLLDYVIKKASKLQFKIIWLSVYIKNNRAINFYQKNEFKNVGMLNFLVNGKEYENIVLSKEIYQLKTKSHERIH